MICRNCGKEIRDDASFCPHCGTVTGGEASSPAVQTGPEAPVSGGGKKKGIFIGAAVAVVAVAALLVVAVSGLFSSPKGSLEKAMGKTFAAWQEAGDAMGMPDLYQLTDQRSVSQRMTLRLNSINSLMLGADGSSLSGLGLRMSSDLDGKARQMNVELGAFWGDDDLASFQVTADDNILYLSSPQFTSGMVYGVNTETLGADTAALGAEDVSDISFNLFDLLDMIAPEGQSQAVKEAVKDANSTLWEAAQVEQGGKETIAFHGNETKADAYQVTIPQDALDRYADEMATVIASLSYGDLYAEIFRAVGLPQAAADEFLKTLEESDPYDALAENFREALKELGDVKLTVCVSGGYVSAVRFRDEERNVKAELYLGGGEAYVDDLRLELDLDGQKVILDSAGDHSGRSGVFTDETTVKGPFPSITSKFSFDLKSSAGNLQWELGMDSAGTLEMAGTLTTSEDSMDLQLENISLRVMGLEVCSLGLDYLVGPCQEAALPEGEPNLIGEMDGMELMALMVNVQVSAQSWLNDMETLFAQRLPAELYQALF